MMKRITIIKCDKCGAEGPSAEGEKRPQVLADAFALGWKMLGDSQHHVCMECAKELEKK